MLSWPNLGPKAQTKCWNNPFEALPSRSSLVVQTSLVRTPVDKVAIWSLLLSIMIAIREEQSHERQQSLYHNLFVFLLIAAAAIHMIGIASSGFASQPNDA